MEMFSLTIVVFPFCSGMHNFAVNTMVKTPAVSTIFHWNGW